MGAAQERMGCFLCFVSVSLASVVVCGCALRFCGGVVCARCATCRPSPSEQATFTSNGTNGERQLNGIAAIRQMGGEDAINRVARGPPDTMILSRAARW